MKNIKRVITVLDEDISVSQINGADYFCLNDMLEIVKDKEKKIDNWLRNKSTLDFIGFWEKKYNPNFNYLEFEEVKKMAGSKDFTFSVKQLTALGAIGLVSRSGRYGGTYSHKDISMEFAMWLSPEFKLHVIHAYQKYLDAINGSIEWQLQRLLSKTSFRLLTDAIKENLVVTKNGELVNKWVYGKEIDAVNQTVFGLKAKEWRAKNPELAAKNMSMRDQADLYTLSILSSVQSYDRILINKGLSFEHRQKELDAVVKDQIKVLFNIDTINDNPSLSLE